MSRKLTPKQEESLGRAILPIPRGIHPTFEEHYEKKMAEYALARARHMASRADHTGCVICAMDPQIDSEGAR